jgi:hypothetical protein
VNLEPYAPAASLLLLGLIALIAFFRVRALMKRYGLAELHPEETTAVQVQPWWASHLDDYTREPPAAPPVRDEGYRPRPEPEPRQLRPEQGPVPDPEPVAQAAAPEHEYVMTAPVELWFGDSRIAVRSGSDTDARFQRFAKVLLDELRSARERV